MLACVRLLLYILCYYGIGHVLSIFALETIYPIETWDVNTQKGIMRGQNLHITKYNHALNKFHTCYEVYCSGKSCPIDNSSAIIQVCYPAIIITGLPKCGTSAMYDLISKMPGAITMHEKENCPATRRRSHWQYLNSLPSAQSVHANSIIVDGCIDINVNMKIRTILHNPHTFYIVMIRDYANMLWSSYNFWCRAEYDKHGCDYSRWVDPNLHIRTPEIFHDLLLADYNNSEIIQPFHKPMHRPCINAGGYYTEYIDLYLYRNNLKEKTIIIASEELESHPFDVAKRVASRVGNDITGLDLHNFTKVRINSQENKGTTHSVAIENYKHGLYNISGNRPMMEKTRQFLNECWKEDCLAISRLNIYNYSACVTTATNSQSITA